MPRARAATLLLYAVTTFLGGCAGSRMASDAPAGATLAGTWRLEPASSDDPQKVLALVRAKNSPFKLTPDMRLSRRFDGTGNGLANCEGMLGELSKCWKD